MTQDILLISASITLLVLTGILIALFISLNRSLAKLGAVLHELSPMIADVKCISNNMAVASDSLRVSMHRISRFTETIGELGEDIEDGRQADKGGMDLLGKVAGPLFSKLNGFRRSLF